MNNQKLDNAYKENGNESYNTCSNVQPTEYMIDQLPIEEPQLYINNDDIEQHFDSFHIASTATITTNAPINATIDTTNTTSIDTNLDINHDTSNTNSIATNNATNNSTNNANSNATSKTPNNANTTTTNDITIAADDTNTMDNRIHDNCFNYNCPNNVYNNTTTNEYENISQQNHKLSYSNEQIDCINNKNDDNPHNDDKPDQVRTLFVSGLPIDVKERELYLLFNGFKGFKCATLRHVGNLMSRPVAFITFETRTDAIVAINKLNCTPFDKDTNLLLKIEFAKSNTKFIKSTQSSSINPNNNPNKYETRHATFVNITPTQNLVNPDYNYFQCYNCGAVSPLYYDGANINQHYLWSQHQYYGLITDTHIPYAMATHCVIGGDTQPNCVPPPTLRLDENILPIPIKNLNGDNYSDNQQDIESVNIGNDEEFNRIESTKIPYHGDDDRIDPNNE